MNQLSSKNGSKVKTWIVAQGARYQFSYEFNYFSLPMKIVGRIRSDLELDDLASQKMAWLVKPVCRSSCQSADFMGAIYSSFEARDPTEQIIFWAHSCNFKGMGTGKHNASTSRLGRPKQEKHFLSLLIQLLQRSLILCSPCAEELRVTFFRRRRKNCSGSGGECNKSGPFFTSLPAPFLLFLSPLSYGMPLGRNYTFFSFLFPLLLLLFSCYFVPQKGKEGMGSPGGGRAKV